MDDLLQEEELDIAWDDSAIMLVDLDAFFASVEQLDHPGWRGKPVIVGGGADKRGVVSTASYEARTFGVHSAMPSATARNLCPQAIWTSGHFDRYRLISDKVMGILLDESPFVQQVSIDEAFVDISPTPYRREDPIAVAQRVQERVKALGVTCSIGLGTTKSVAKVASDRDKPEGLTIVYPGREQAFLSPLPLKVMSGIGTVAQSKLERYGIRTLGDVASADEGVLKKVFGKNASMMRNRCLGCDENAVETTDEVKSISSEMSFSTDISDRRSIEGSIATMAAKVCRRMRKHHRKGTTLTLKVRYADLKIRTAQCALDTPLDDEFEAAACATRLLDRVWSDGMPLRLVGVALSGFSAPANLQGRLFDDGLLAGDDSASSLEQEEKRRGLIRATDKIRDRFGEDAVRFGREERASSSSTGTAAKNPEDYRR